MINQIKTDYDKIVKTSSFSTDDIKLKRQYLNKFIENGFPNRKLENWKFSDISQIIQRNIGELSFYNDYSSSNKIDTSIFIDGLEHNKIFFINGRVEKIDFSYEDKNKVEIEMTLTSPNCPVAESLPKEVKNNILKIEGIKDVNLKLVWDPPWSKDKMSEAAKLELNL